MDLEQETGAKPSGSLTVLSAKVDATMSSVAGVERGWFLLIYARYSLILERRALCSFCIYMKVSILRL